MRIYNIEVARAIGICGGICGLGGAVYGYMINDSEMVQNSMLVALSGLIVEHGSENQHQHKTISNLN